MAKRRRVAVMIDLEWPVRHHYEVYFGIQRFAEERTDWECVLDPFAGRTIKSGHAHYDGIIARATKELVDCARQRKIPIVNVWLHSPAKRQAPGVFPNSASVGRLAGQHLCERGFKRFAYLGLRRSRSSSIQRQAFFQSVRSSGIHTTDLLVQLSYGRSPQQWRHFIDQMQVWVRSWQPPVGVLVQNERLCRYLVQTCESLGLAIPNEVALVCSDLATDLCLRVKPTLSTIDLAYENVGIRAAEILQQLMLGRKPPTEPVLVEPLGLIARQSSDAFAVDDELVSAALKYIDEHCHQALHVGDVAASLATTLRTLQRRFRDRLDRPIAYEINRFRVDRVKRALIDSDKLLKQIAASNGFTNAGQMSEVFQRITGVTPSAYRETWRHSRTGH